MPSSPTHPANPAFDTSTSPPTPPRIPPLPSSEWPPVLRSLLADSQADGPGRENLFGTLAHHPALAHAWLSLARVLTHEGTLGHRRRELVVLRTAHRLDAAYVYERHRTPAAQAGLTAEEIEATAADPHTHLWAPEELVLLQACDLLAANAPVPDGLWDGLARALRPEQLVELLVLTGQTATMCTALNVLRTPSDGTSSGTTSSDSVARQRRHLTVSLDRERCCSAGQCVGAAPEVFEQSERDGRVTLLIPEPDQQHAADVRLAADLCPSGAITLVDTP
ncbi:ferredoxin [Streptomyces phaeochromogenes]|uniref:Ferredoxin n=1 Tax=Streptomyces phaeochromogenes TaxID=1923 RepID=A0ABZ1HE53_STRPH|nr:ferredoxin [Streptomyces phaeochromogenes]WSD15843.1 ferredoxin [Streptomyces phaeochromogenes]